MLTVPEALARILALLSPVGVETIPLAEAAGRVLAEPVRATRDQPPFRTTAMDGYAVRAADCAPGRALRVVGEAPAGRAWTGRLGPGEALRIFTGAPMPEGADAVLIQEDAERAGDIVTARATASPGDHVRPQGLDFRADDVVPAPRRLAPADVALIAAMGAAQVVVRRRPRVALLPTGDELVEPGAAPAPDQIFASNHYGLAALLAAQGAAPRLEPIAPDRPEALAAALRRAADADLIVTLGGASVGDYDLVGAALGERAFYKVAMRPGKPLMAGRVEGAPVVGLPGNPVSAMVCGHVFLRAAVDALLGVPAAAPVRETAVLGCAVAAEGPREHYRRARLSRRDGALVATPYEQQDSSVLSLLAGADALVVRPAHAPPAAEGDRVAFIRLRDA
ncbi:MAG: molybdopterin molybdenumtransferase MoeA [Rhodobacteraceae bacterium]|nr:MAG: molybdopterin molybdenumtransferase MoeA [Paracoccaceae bacterium]